jgi:hypothetical protein
MKQKHFTKIIWALTLTIVQIQTIAAEVPTFDDDVQDNPPASINDWIIPVFFIAIGLAYYLCLKTTRNSIKN